MKPTRRDFVRMGALATSALAISPAFENPATGETYPEKPALDLPVKLGLASYTFRNFTRAQLIRFMKELKALALNAKDVKDHLPMDPSQEAVALADYTAAGIRLHAIGAVSFSSTDEADIRSKFEYAKRAGVSVIVAGDPTVENLPRIEKFVREYNIRLAIHNHGPEDKLWHSPLDVLRVVKDMDPRIGCCIDVGHAARAGTNVVEAIHEVGPRLFNVHMKDLTDFRSKESQVAVGDGIMPVRGIFGALLETKYPGFVDLEYEVHPDDPMPGVSSSFAYMRGVLAGMGYTDRSPTPFA
jgi:sugar phosphate isomerase/epimerase